MEKNVVELMDLGIDPETGTLPPRLFLRLDRTNLINMMHVKWIDYENRLVYFDDEVIPGVSNPGYVSHSKLKEYKKLFDYFIQIGRLKVLKQGAENY